MHVSGPSRILAICLSAATLALGCGSNTSASSSSTSTSTLTPNAYTTVYKSLSWGSTVTVTFPTTCEMTLTTTGKPDYTPNPYYLAPSSAGMTTVAYTSSHQNRARCNLLRHHHRAHTQGFLHHGQHLPRARLLHHRNIARSYRLSHLRHRHVQPL